MKSLSVIIAPDSFKGSLDAAAAADAVAEGWRRVRPDDQVTAIPQADGGEGTLDAVSAAQPEAVRHVVAKVTGPDGRAVRGEWLELGDGTAIVEMAQMSGLPLMAAPDPMGATSKGLGEVIAAALDHGAARVIVGLGGSASTDGGAGALSALGLELLDHEGRGLPLGGAALTRLGSIRGGPRRPDELVLLSDVHAPLLGTTGAARIFGPQKGASEEQIAQLEAGLGRFAELLGGANDLPGMGAAGGVGYGLGVGLGGTIKPGAPYLSALSGFDVQVAAADVVISGEGRFDQTSLGGKVVGHILGLAKTHKARRAVIVGQVALDHPDIWAQSLAGLSGSVEAAIAEPRRWLVEAGATAAWYFGSRAD